ncbi:MAG: GNAT family N-acetyltransferase [Chloroflexota bacterium]
MSAPFTVRDAEPPDLPFLGQMLIEANHLRDENPHLTLKQAMAEPMVGRYLAGWGRPGDRGVVAVDPDGRRCGAAWYRLFTADEPGWATIDALTPELTLAVSARWRGRGVGTAILAALLDRARADGRPGVSLSVFLGNAVAVRLYRSAGFETLSEGHGWAQMLWRPDRTSPR